MFGGFGFEGVLDRSREGSQAIPGRPTRAQRLLLQKLRRPACQPESHLCRGAPIIGVLHARVCPKSWESGSTEISSTDRPGASARAGKIDALRDRPGIWPHV